MFYYSYRLRWKSYKTLATLKADQKSDFDIKYSNSYLDSLNQEYYESFVKNGDYLLTVIHRGDGEMDIAAAVKIPYVNDKKYISKISEKFDDCKIISEKELTISEFKNEINSCHYLNKGTSYYFALTGIDFRGESFFSPLPFEYNESIHEYTKMSKRTCINRAKEILGSASLLEEIDRIYSKENAKAYFGHPVHYLISAGDYKAAQDMYELLLNALIYNKRLLSGRISEIRHMQKKAYSDERFKPMVTACEGGTVIIELNGEDSMGRFATDFHETTKAIGELLEKTKKDTLFIFIEVMGKTARDNDALNNITEKADIIQIREGTGTYAQAKKYLFELADKVDFITDEKSDIVEFLPDNESYTVTDIFNAYNSWYGCGLKSHIYKAYKDKKTYKVEVTAPENKPYDELKDMVGLNGVKSVVDRIISASKVIRARERMGLNTEDASMHMMFSGNPGTAKTTVARLLAKILKEEDAIYSGKFVECGRQDLVGKYVGWTAPIVEKKFHQASGGILFIDEAYSLIDDSNTYGAEAINCITQMMENFRNSVIVVFAGYPDKMKDFLAQNEGLKSRIAFHLDFPDYTPDELVKITELLAKKKDYNLSDEAAMYCREIFENACTIDNFGNGRFARNVLEQAILSQSDRIVKDLNGEELNRDEMCLLIKDDFSIPSGFSDTKIRKMGFCM